MRCSELQLKALSRELVKDGFFFHRLYFDWGFTPGIRNRNGSRFYFLLVEEERIVTPSQMHDHLLANWHPTSMSEVLFHTHRLAAHFASYPKDIPEWSGLDVSMILQHSESGITV